MTKKIISFLDYKYLVSYITLSDTWTLELFLLMHVSIFLSMSILDNVCFNQLSKIIVSMLKFLTKLII